VTVKESVNIVWTLEDMSNLWSEGFVIKYVLVWSEGV